jgi:RHS repeat-associated protein
MESAIVIAALTKSFGRETALRDVSLCIAPGSVFALVGANGAGKTTLLKILMNILAPTSGHANILGLATAAGAQDYDPYPNLCWSYDDFGNRTAQTASATAYTSSNGGTNSCPVGSGPSYLATYNADNQLSGGLYGYDAAGDVTADSTTGNSYLYDGEGRICAMQQSVDGLSLMTQYIYDADGVRVAKGTISAFSCNTATNGFVATTVYVLGPGGEQMTEMTSVSGTWQLAHTNVDAGALSATYDADLSGQTEGKMYFHLSDWLGTRRQQTDYAGNPMLNFTGLPYGDGLATIPVSTADVADATEHHFTGKERDSESGNDYFGARYYASSMGRFISPDFNDDDDDPEPVPFADLDNPQSLNLYSYVGNNPLSATDIDGHFYNGTHCAICHEMTPQMQQDQEAQDRQMLYLQIFLSMERSLLLGRHFNKPAAATPTNAPAQAQSTPADPNDKNEVQKDDNNKEQKKESTPKSDPKDFKSIKGRPGKINVSTGEVWVKDPSGHGGEHYEVYKSVRDYENGDRAKQVWADGSPGRIYK